jgi:hypothetical protein
VKKKKMRTKLIAIISAILVLASLAAVVPVCGVNDQNGLKPGTDFNGPHYNLNIIGVSKDKNPDAEGWTNPNRHTIFVGLEKPSKIYMQDGPKFAVIDADGTDGVAKFQLKEGYYEVYAAALGKPGKWVIITPDATYEEGYEIQDQVFALENIELTHHKNPKWERVTGLFLVTVTLMNTEDPTQTITYTNKWIFDIPELFEYWWEYDNHGQKLVKVRFYPVAEEPLP